MVGRPVIDAQRFRRVLGQYPTGVCVVTATTPAGDRAGFVVGSFTSVSLDPPLVAFFPDKGSTSWPKVHEAGRFCVNVLGADQEDICRRFASKGADKFAGLDHGIAGSGAPVLDEVVAWIDCDLESVQEAGDHYMVLGRVRELDVGSPKLPLLFFQGGYGRFSPLSLAVAASGGVPSERLRKVDLARPEMERLAEALDARCIATARVDDEHLIVTASAGGANTSAAATLVGQRLPLVPPTGAAFMAWADPATIEDWLLQVDDASRDGHRQRLVAVRRRRCSVGLLNDAQRVFAAKLDRLAEAPGSVSSDDLRGLASGLAYDPIELAGGILGEIRIISAPVFGAAGDVQLVLSVYGFANPTDAGEIEHHIRRVLEAADRATARLGGTIPQEPRDSIPCTKIP